MSSSKKFLSFVVLCSIALFALGCECSQSKQSHQRTLLQPPLDETDGEHLVNYFGEYLPENLSHFALAWLIGP